MEVTMTKGNPFPIILKFMIPLFIGNVFQQLYNMADTIIVGRFVSSDALAAVGATGNIMFLVLGFSQGLCTGFTVLTSQSYGAQNYKRVKRSVANGILLALIVICIVTLLSVSLMRPLLHLMNTPANIYQDSLTYITIICAGTVCSVYYNLFSAFIRSIGNSKVPLYFLIFSACLNVGLDLIFIIVGKMGVAGAAWATNLSQGISAILCLVYIHQKATVLWPDKKDWHINRVDTQHQMAVGVPMALQFGITASGTMVMQSAINLFGSTAVAAYTAANKLNSLMVQEMLAMGQAVATYCGQNYGCRDSNRINKGVHAAIVIEVTYAILAAILCVFLLKPVMSLFFANTGSVTDGEVLDTISLMMPWARTYNHTVIMFYIPLSFIFIFRNAMQGCGHGFLPMMGGVVEFFARLIVALIAMHLTSFQLAVFCDPAAWIAAGTFTAVSYSFVIKRVRRELARME
ncbi:MATE family efflux transporter [Oribacterium sp. WCC10]|uniref:MATE family efflux transporter n=1 Tax=Oribacterium sp. WCC10 TaxID=1855343 RepID=UPI0008E8951B|nr:MATE family efflux transporter [Oribacterium sp. WCC10]SFG15080.1 putative efflux protein, MATE family [Oribacterium sp. WCC10]